MSAKKNLKAFQTTKNPSGSVSLHQLSGEKYRASISTMIANDLKGIQLGTFFNDRNALEQLQALYRLTTDKKIDLAALRVKKTQQAALVEMLKGFFEKLGLPYPETDKAALEKLSSIMLTAERNLSLIHI